MKLSAEMNSDGQPGISWLLVGYAGLVAGAIYLLCIG
jgi:hypothetical protein